VRVRGARRTALAAYGHTVTPINTAPTRPARRSGSGPARTPSSSPRTGRSPTSNAMTSIRVPTNKVLKRFRRSVRSLIPAGTGSTDRDACPAAMAVTAIQSAPGHLMPAARPPWPKPCPVPAPFPPESQRSCQIPAGVTSRAGAAAGQQGSGMRTAKACPARALGQVDRNAWPGNAGVSITVLTTTTPDKPPFLRSSRARASRSATACLNPHVLCKQRVASSSLASSTRHNVSTRNAARCPLPPPCHLLEISRAGRTPWRRDR